MASAMAIVIGQLMTNACNKFHPSGESLRGIGVAPGNGLAQTLFQKVNQPRRVPGNGELYLADESRKFDHRAVGYRFNFESGFHPKA